MIQSILRFDYMVFSRINGQWHNSFLDLVLPFMRNPFFWVPLYLFLLLFMTINFTWKGVLWCVFFLLTFGCTDFVNSHLIKFWVLRIRPCNDPVMSHFTRLLIPCGSGYSFPSSHATNHFGLAMFMFLSLRGKFGPWMALAFVWAFIVSYSQIYVGVHYPIDVTAGCLIGLFFGSITGRIFNRKIGLEPFK